MTSNIGSQYLLEGLTEGGGAITDKARNQVMAALRQSFRPEFLNRGDETVLFAPLQLEEIGRIVTLMVGDLRKRLADRHLELHLTEAARLFIAKEGYDPVYGARPLKRFLQRELETRLGRELIGGELLDGATIRVDHVEGQGLIVTHENPEIVESPDDHPAEADHASA